VDAVKFQTFTAEEFVSDSREIYTYRLHGKKITESMLHMFKRHEFSKKEWKEIFSYCSKKDIICFSTPQNSKDLDFLFKISELPIIKVGSDDLTNLELIKYYASKNKPLFISAGMAFLSEIEDAVNTVKEAGNDNLVVLHCVSSYPARAEEINLKKMLAIKKKFGVLTGFSDHTKGIEAAVAAVSIGAKVIEKHFTLDKNLNGPDHWFSAEPRELTRMVRKIREAEKMLGSDVLKPTAGEREMRRIARRSIVAAKDIKKGEFIRKKFLSVKRPGTGLSPKFMNSILEKKAKINIKKNELITFEKLSR